MSIADEVPFEIPDSWEWVRVKSIARVLGGKRIPAGRKLSSENTGHIYIRVSDMKNHSINTSGLLYVPEDIFPSISRYIIKKEDLYITVAGTIGHVGKIPPELDGANLTENADRLVFYNINQKWLMYCLSSPLVQNQIADATTKVGQPKLAIIRIESLLVPLPPFEEQSKIVNRIKEVETLIDRYSEQEENLNRLNNSFPEQLKKSILQMAVQGKLAPQVPNDEPASVLLEKIHTKKEQLIKEGKIKRDKNESVIFRRDNSHYEKLGSQERCIDDEIPFDIPDTWEWCRLSSILSLNPRNQIPDDTIVGFMPMPLLEDGFNNCHTFEERKWKAVKSGFTHFKNNDVVIAKITPCFQNRKSAVIRDLPNGYGAGTTELHVLRDVTHFLYMPYILLICKTHAFIAGGISAFTGTAGQQRVGKEYIANYLIPLPPIQEQIRIINFAQIIFKSLDELL